MQFSFQIIYYNNYIEQNTFYVKDVIDDRKKNSLKQALKWVFSGFGIFFISMLFFMLVHDTLTGESSTTSEYCTKYGFLASPDCW